MTQTRAPSQFDKLCSDDVIRETSISSGAVYVRFRGKDKRGKPIITRSAQRVNEPTPAA